MWSGPKDSVAVWGRQESGQVEQRGKAISVFALLAVGSVSNVASPALMGPTVFRGSCQWVSWGWVGGGVSWVWGGGGVSWARLGGWAGVVGLGGPIRYEHSYCVPFCQDVLVDMDGRSTSLNEFVAPCFGVYYFSIHAMSSGEGE
ncbi:hypothetical protein Pcinc_021093 [Petrolisthes cinctipes]|uniref:Uncharacterized protein n=1 Tax=Petrolisthes cinctipes TaxID=88211 RepID=A0AAE1KFJ4_PETCI|nr:hypothetical protein Pcinc_021093 [Petrolisthes cinctipes]